MAIDLYNQQPAPDPQAQPDMAAPYVTGEAGNGDFGARQTDHQKLIAWIDHPNIATELDSDKRSAIGQRVKREYDLDLGTRSDWEDRSRVAMDLAMQVAKEKTHPWPRSSNIVYPLMTVAAIQFAARSYPAIIQSRSVVKGVVSGKDNGIPRISPQDGTPLMQMGQDGKPQPLWERPPGALRERANRIGEHMSWQLLEEMKEWERETDKLLHILPIIGCAFRKSFYDPAFGCNSSVLVMAENLIVNYWAKSIERAQRLSEDFRLYPREIEEKVRADLFIEHDYGIASDANGDDDAPHEFIEQHRYLDLDEDGYAEPYIVTVHKALGKVVRITSRYDAEGVQVKRSTGDVVKIDPVHYYTQYDFLPALDGGIYGTGFGQLLGPINSAVNTTLNMMFDAEHLKITGGGFIGRGLSMHAGSVKFKPNEWKPINVPGATLKDSIVPLPAPGASSVMFTLLGFLVEAGKEVANIKDILSGEAKAETMQPTTLIALIEQGLKVYTGIFKRIYTSADSEFNKLYRLNRIYLEHQAKFQVGEEWKIVTKEDYARGAGVQPISDPAMVSDMQKMARTQFLMQFANDPDFKGLEIKKEALNNAQIENIDRFINENPGPNPAVIVKQAEMELEGRKAEAMVATEKAKQVNLYAQATNYLASADKAVGDQHFTWIEKHIDLLRLQLESLQQPAGNGGDEQGMPPPPQGGPPTAIPGGVAPPPALAGPGGPMGHPQQMPFQAPPDEMSFHNGPFARPGQ